LKVLITGGAGFIGSHLADAFLARGDEVTILDIASDLKVRHHLDDPRFRYVRDSIMNREIVEGLVSWCDLVYHLAAVVGVAMAIATEPAGEIERRFVDVILARPAGRADVVTRSVVLVVGATACLVGAMVAGGGIGDMIDSRRSSNASHNPRKSRCRECS